jgi:hypothetical protein
MTPDGRLLRPPREVTMKALLLSIAAILALPPLRASAEPAPPFVGTWKLDLAKSDYGGQTPARSAVHRYEAVEGGLKAVMDGVAADGK